MYFPLCIVISVSVLFENVHCDDMDNAPLDSRRYFSEVDGDLTRVKWVHRCNSQAKLDDALANKEVMMIEADIIAGHLESDPSGNPIPVMGHPPSTMGDISLEQFLHKVLDRRAGKGIKLDFKSTAIFKASENVLEDFLAKAEVDFPVWINADILRGPGMTASREVVDAKYFLKTCVSKFPTAYISPGWAVDPEAAQDLKYDMKNIDEMLSALTEANIVHGVTFPVHAGIASNSVDTLTKLIKTSVDGTTLTLWAADGQWVSYKNLQQLVDAVGRDKVYVDMPKGMMNKLNGEESEESKGSAAVTVASGVVMLCSLLSAFH